MIVLIELYGGSDELGQEVFLLGRGDYSNGMQGVRGSDHALRRVTNRVDEVDGYWLKMCFDEPLLARYLKAFVDVVIVAGQR